MAASSIYLPILGIHGNSQVVAWSAAMVDDTPLDKALPPTALDRDDVYNECENRKQKMIRGKGKMSLGVGSLVARICQAIISDNGSVCLISHFQPNWGCCFSLPAVLGKGGIIKTLEMPLSSSESEDLEKSLRDLKDRLGKIYEEK
jgi:L-lactate dehydrogenase